MNKIFSLQTSILLFCLLISMTAVAADTPSPSPVNPNPSDFLIRFVDARGKIYGRPVVQKAEWVWSKSALSSQDNPALRVWIYMVKPEKLSFLMTDEPETSGPEISVVNVEWGPQDQTLVLDLRSTKGTVQLTLNDKKKNDVQLSLFLQYEVKATTVLVQPDCAKYGFSINPVKTEGKHLYVGATCSETTDAYDIYFFRSMDSTWDYEDQDLVSLDPTNARTQFKFHMPRPSDATVYATQVFKAGTMDEAGSPNTFVVTYAPKTIPKRFYFSVGMGVSLYEYKETATSVDLHQASLTPKLNVGYRLVPKLFDVAINAFGNAVTLYHTPSSIPSATWYGFNGRIGYRLPIDLGATEFMLLTGLYIWSMQVKDNAYGIQNLSGPQIFLMMSNAQQGHHPYWGYFKYALMNETATQISSIDNHELAIGGGYGLSTDPKTYSLTLDITQVHFGISNTSVNNSLSLLSITAGVQKPF